MHFHFLPVVLLVIKLQAWDNANDNDSHLHDSAMDAGGAPNRESKK
jgi:hypothetical protein